jgi:amino acid adenylation domain-containing protein
MRGERRTRAIDRSLDWLVQGSAQSIPSPPAIRARARPEPHRLSFAQHRLWFLEQLDPGNIAYNVPLTVRLRGDLDVAAFRAALNAVVARHEVLRTTFVVHDEEPLQVVADQRVVDLRLLDLAGLADRGSDATLHDVLRADARRPFDLSSDLMLRAFLVRLASDDHVLLLTMHHIASDGWSVGVLTRELSELYAAQVQGRPPALSPLPIQYGDYAAWQRATLTDDTFRTQLAYWTKQLTGMPPNLELPTDRPRPTVLGHQGAQVTTVLPHDLVDALKALCRHERVTLFMTLLTAFQTLLHRYTGSDDVIVGTAVAGRRLVETEGLIGLFANTLALRSDLSGDPTCREALARVRDVVLGAFDHQDAPFEKLVEALRPERNLSWPPVVQVMLTFQEPDPAILALTGLKTILMDIDTESARFDLAASIAEMPEGLCVKATYNTQLYEPATIRRMLGHYQTLLSGLVADPDQRLSHLPLLTPAERYQLFIEWNATAVPTPHQCVHQLFEAQVQRTPEAVALTFGDQSLTYQQLNQRANGLARCLEQRGVGPEVLVGLCLERSFDLIVGLLGILKAGAAYVPLDPGDPQARFAYMLRDARLSLLVTHRPILQRLHDLQVPTVCLDDEWHVVAEEERTDGPSRATLVNPACVIYTSGSTGTPKGVVITHGGLSNFVTWRQAALPTTNMDVVLQSSPITFGGALSQVFPSLLAGARLVLLRPGAHRDCRSLIETIRTERVSHIAVVPSLMRAMVEEPGLEACTSLRRVVCGGEALPWSVLRRFCARLDVEFVNFHGLTETTAATMYWTASSAGGVGQSETVPIGRPMGNTQVYVLDSHMQPVPVGVPGELYIGGAGLARGYLGRPDLTAERFIPNPFGSEPGARLYKSGDRVRYLPSGSIEYLGRLDYQVKIRGFRVELGEIETKLREHPDVRDTVVAVWEPTPGDKRLAAYLVLRASTNPTPNSLRRFAKAKLPEYMVPSAFTILPSLPLTTSGKVDRRSLPVPNHVQPEYVPPRSTIERRLVAIWEELLSIHPVGITDNFFEIGGHSLLAGRLLVRVRAALSVDVTMRAFFDAPTIEGLCTAVIQGAIDDSNAEAMRHLLREQHNLSDEGATRLLADA